MLFVEFLHGPDNFLILVFWLPLQIRTRITTELRHHFAFPVIET